jgi:hypothetical protein
MELQGRLMGAPDAAVVAGDVRANENIALTSMHTLFMREHNRIVNELPRSLPAEVRFQIARRVVGAEIQYITYNEFLPALGVKLDAYTGYKPNVNPSLSNEFAVVGYRAHSLIHGELEVRGDLSRFPAEKADALRALGIVIQVADDDVRMEVPLNVAFGNPDLLPLLGLAPVLSTLARDPQYKNDEQFDDQLRSVLFQVPAPGVADPSACLDGSGLPNCFNGVVDLGAIDIARARDHGVPYYNDLRTAYGLPRKESFAAITGESTEQFPTTDPLIDAANPLADRNILDFVQLLDRAGNGLDPRTGAAGTDAVVGIRRTTLAARLKGVYGDVGTLDPIVGMLAEPHLPGSELGELQHAIWKRQFQALRDGDRFFYVNDRSLRIIQKMFDVGYKTTLKGVIIRNTELGQKDLQPNVFRGRR